MSLEKRFTMNNHLPFALSVILGLLLGASSFAADDRTQRPNIIFFYADDLGYGDLACYGSKAAQTPRLDALARKGTRFTQFYVSHCVCSPTRASILTGMTMRNPQ